MTATLRDPLGGQTTTLRQRDADCDETGTEAGSVGEASKRQLTPARNGGSSSGQPPLRLSRAPSGGSDLAAARRAGPSFAAACVDVMPILPTIGAIATVFAYIGVGDATGVSGVVHLWPLVTGGVAAVSLGLAMAACYRPFFTAPDQAHPQSFAELRQRLDSLGSQLRVLSGRAAGELTPSQQLAVADATAHQRALERDLARGGPHWIIGTGYVDALTRLHRAEEALILVQPAEDVVAGALFDELRLNGSTIPERERLLGNLRTAVQVIGPNATPYLNRPPADSPGSMPADLPAGQQPAAAVGPARTGCTLQKTQARMVLQGVRRTINDFRDESRARLIRSRWRLIGTMTVTGAITYVLLAFAVTVSPGGKGFGSDPIAAAAAIYLVGAVVGLFNRLYMESGDESAVEDYGLSKTRLLLTPMLSGLAAVGGVMIVGMLSGIVDVTAFTPVAGITPTPTPTLAPTPGIDSASVSELIQGKPAREAVLSLADVFSLEQYRFGLVLAAIFGLMPKRFLERLQRASEQTKLDLQSTAATRQ